jgi:hypothetical protein
MVVALYFLPFFHHINIICFCSWEFFYSAVMLLIYSRSLPHGFYTCYWYLKLNSLIIIIIIIIILCYRPRWLSTQNSHERTLSGSSLHRKEFFEIEEMNFRKCLLKMGRIRRQTHAVHSFGQTLQTGYLKCMHESSKFPFQKCVILCPCHELRCQPNCALKFSGFLMPYTDCCLSCQNTVQQCKVLWHVSCWAGEWPGIHEHQGLWMSRKWYRNSPISFDRHCHTVVLLPSRSWFSIKYNTLSNCWPFFNPTYFGIWDSRLTCLMSIIGYRMYADSDAMNCANTLAEASGAGRVERLRTAVQVFLIRVCEWRVTAAQVGRFCTCLQALYVLRFVTNHVIWSSTVRYRTVTKR